MGFEPGIGARETSNKETVRWTVSIFPQGSEASAIKSLCLFNDSECDIFAIIQPFSITLNSERDITTLFPFILASILNGSPVSSERYSFTLPKLHL